MMSSVPSHLDCAASNSNDRAYLANERLSVCALPSKSHQPRGGCAAVRRDRLRDLERLRDRETAAERDRLRQIKLDVVANDDTDDELPMWQRRPYSTR